MFSFYSGDDEKQWKQEPYYFNLNERIYIPPVEVEEPPSFAKKELEKAQSMYLIYIKVTRKKASVTILDDGERLQFS